MRKNIIQAGTTDDSGNRHIEHDWYPLGIPPNVSLAEAVYIDTSYGFAAFHSRREPGLSIGKGTGCYDRTNFIAGPQAVIDIGEFTILNGTTIVARQRVRIGSHCMLAWGSVLTDSWTGEGLSRAERAELLRATAHSAHRLPPGVETGAPVVVEDNVWIGFDAVILPGVRLGRGCIIGSRCIIYDDVPAYAVMVGDPARMVRKLPADDTAAARQQAMEQHLLPPHKREE